LALKTVDSTKNSILRNPLTVKQLASQIKKSCDLYIALKLNEKDFKELLLHYAGKHGCRFFGKNGGLNPTLEKVIGKKRKELIEIMLCDYQQSLF